MNKTLSTLAVSSAIIALTTACIPQNIPPKPDVTYTWYQDVDGDGYGDPSTKFTGDKPGADWVSNEDDCDDSNAAINPDAIDSENRVDDNCDGKTDDNVNYVFATSILIPANMKTAVNPDTFNGLDGADAICQNLADANAAPSGHYKAWLSDIDTSAADRLDHSQNKYILVDGTLIATNWDNLTSGSIRKNIDLDEKGNTIPAYDGSSSGPGSLGSGMTWTATQSNGIKKALISNTFSNEKASYCDNWTSTTAQTSDGTGNKDTALVYGGSINGNDTARWSKTGGIYCDNKSRLYCFRQD